MRRGVVVVILLLAAFVLAEADPGYPQGPRDKPYPKTKKVKCKDKYSPCYKEDLYCPESCPKSCWVDCDTCQPICDAVYTPPPPYVHPSPPTVTPTAPPPYVHPSPPTVTPTASPPYVHPSPPTVTPTASPPYVHPSPPTVTPTASPPYVHPSPPTVTPTPPASAVNPKHAKCKNKNYPTCYQRQFSCPESCPGYCEVDCVTCKPLCDCNKPGAVCQDPRFVGADGLTFYFHGKKDQDFCLVADSNLHINAHFIGKRNANMGRDFTWVQSLGILFNNHKLYIGARKTATWNDATDRLSLSFDGQPIDLNEAEGASWESTSNGVTISRSKATNAVEIEVENKFKIKTVVVPITEKESMIHKYGITQEDCFAHLDLSFKFYSLSEDVNGVLGQTYASNYVSRVNIGARMSVLGGEKEFHSSSLFATDCAVAKFNGNGNGNGIENQGMDFADLNCVSGINGRGVVCKR